MTLSTTASLNHLVHKKERWRHRTPTAGIGRLQGEAALGRGCVETR